MMKGIQFCLLLVCVWGYSCNIVFDEDSEMLASKCIDNEINTDRIGAQIVNGEKTTRGEFPHMALLLSSNSLRCGGSLISSRHVLTAAHCVSGMRASWLKVRMGAYAHARGNENGSATYQVKAFKMYPKAGTWKNDVAVLTLDEDVQYTSMIKPIRLAKPSNGKFVNWTAILTGWGNTVGGGRLSPTLLKLNTSIVENEFCTAMFKNQSIRYPNVTETNVCAYRRNQSACHGDSGSPIFVYHCCTGEPIQIGVVNGGHVGCRLGMPNIFSRVSEYYSWIMAVVNNSTSPATTTPAATTPDDQFNFI